MIDALALIVAVVVGFLVGRSLWLLLRPVFLEPLFHRENFRGRLVSTAVGLLIAIAVLVVEALRLIAGALGVGVVSPGPVRIAVLLAAMTFGLLGLVDDLAGAGPDRGFRGHLSALSRGRLTTGGLKLFGGGAAALVTVVTVRGEVSPVTLGVDAGLVALTANLANLLDRAPGRTTKFTLVSFAALALGTLAHPALVPFAVIAGAAVATLPEDLRERTMLGDAGANVVGAALGLAFVASTGLGVRVGALVAVAALNVASEFVSFSRVIDAVPPLRLLDRLGREP